METGRQGPPAASDGLRRSATIERAAGDGGEVTLSFALASETPVERWFGVEVLAMDGVDLSRAEGGGLPLLCDHNPTDIVGVLENVRVDADKVIRGTPRWSRSARAQEIAQDVMDGIRTGVSIGYQVREWKESKQAGGPSTYTALRWTLLEGSLVAIPADATVGVGRSADDAASPAMSPERVETPEVRMSAGTPPAGGAPPAADTRVADLEALAANPPSPELKGFAVTRMAEWIRGGTTPAEARIQMYEELSRKHAEGAVAPAGPELSRKEVKEFSIARAVKTLLEGRRDGFEFEVSDELAKAQGRSTEGFLVPWQVEAQQAFRGFVPRNGQRANEVIVGTQADGGYLKFTEYAGFVDLFRQRLVTLRMGVQYIPGLTSDFQWVRKTAGSTGGWQSTELTNQSNSKWTLNVVTLQPKIYQDAIIASRKMFTQSIEALEPLLRNEIFQTHAVAIEAAVLAGTGASGQPTGISATSGIGDVAGGTNGLQPTYANIMELWSDVAGANVPTDSFGIVTHPLGVSRLSQTPRFSSTDTPLWDTRLPGRECLGFRSDYTGAVPSNQTKGAANTCYYIYGGMWDQAVLGEFGSTEVVLDPYTLAPSQVKLASIQMVDVGVLYPAAFSVMKDALP